MNFKYFQGELGSVAIKVDSAGTIVRNTPGVIVYNEIRRKQIEYNTFEVNKAQYEIDKLAYEQNISNLVTLNKDFFRSLIPFGNYNRVRAYGQRPRNKPTLPS